MVFSFFRKKDSDPDTGMRVPGAGTAQPAKTGAGSAGPDSFLPDHDTDGFSSGIEVSNGDSQLSPAEEQAAILHANNESAAAVPVLQAEILEVRGQRRIETWLMLFELHQQLGDRASFENLGLDYVVEFEKTPPIWRENKALPAKKAQVSGSNCIFGTLLTAETIEKELKMLRGAAAKAEPLRLDFSKTKDIDSLAAAEILAVWQQAKKMTSSRQVLGGTSFSQLLQGKIETGRAIPAEAPFWLLLIDLYQALGRQEDFDNLAIDYAITFEVSPPSWDARLAPKPADKSAMEAEQAVTDNSHHEGLQLTGEITAKYPQGLNEIREYSQRGSGEIVLDFEAVKRVDFESAGQFLNIFMDSLQHDHRVRIVRVNELVYAMLRLMGVSELVSVERRKA